ncbi:uncharacterized protein [Misgurnus anguillicaudatus]|uniref:uncharacterized protein isoform X2 n=1 Tax=Misgurnus anguillicaudatus TaxID=75329 RepID=UPI003CCF9E08
MITSFGLLILQKSMGFNSAFISLILLSQGFLTSTYSLQVKCEYENICAVRETSVILKCNYSDINIKTGFWFSQKQRTNWRNKDEPEDLTLDSDYSGRVKQQITNTESELTISDLRERDSGEYQLMFIMKDGVKHLSSVTVNLTVTVLQAKIDHNKLTCDTSCPLTFKPQHIYWKKDGRYIKESESKAFSLSSAAYSCFLRPDSKISSDSLCLSNSGCWGVTYTSRRVCALVGSTVDIHSSYSHPTGDTVEKTYWHLPNNKNSKYQDLRDVDQFAGRVEYMNNTLRIKNVKMSDSGEYLFRIITNTNSYAGLPGVILTVTDTQVISSPVTVSERWKVILSCSTKCTLDNKYTYIWYKNGSLVTDRVKLYNKLYLDSVSSEEIQEYSCAVGDADVHQVPDSKMSTKITTVVLFVLLILAVIGILCYRRRRKYISSQKCDDTKPSAQPQPDSSTLDNSTPLYAEADVTHQTHSEEQDLHYSSVNFKQTTYSTPTIQHSSTDNVYYATVKSK